MDVEKPTRPEQNQDEQRNGSAKLGEISLEAAELKDIIEQYNKIVSQHEQLSIIGEEDDPYEGSPYPTQYIEIYAKIDDQTPLSEAKKKISKIQKAIAIDNTLEKYMNRPYDELHMAEEELHKIGKEIVGYLSSNEDQFDPLDMELRGSALFPDGRRIIDNTLPSNNYLGAELFWNLQNDSMSIESWAYYIAYREQYGYEYKYKTEDGREIEGIRFKTLPEVEDYYLILEEEQYERQKQQKIKISRETQPNIFVNPDQDMIESNVGTLLREINTAAIREISKEADYKAVNEKLIQYLSEIFGLEEPINILYKPKTGNTAGSYSHSFREITLYEEQDRDQTANISDIDTIAHEMWHAYQHEVIDNSEKAQSELQPELYEENFRYYINSKEDFDGYRCQLVEAEARRFAELFIKNAWLFPELPELPPEEGAVTERIRLSERSRARGRKAIMAYILAGTIGAGATFAGGFGVGAIINSLVSKNRHNKYFDQRPKSIQTIALEEDSQSRTTTYYDFDKNTFIIENEHQPAKEILAQKSTSFYDLSLLDKPASEENQSNQHN